MPARNRRQAACPITWKKVVSTRVSAALCLGFAAVLAFFWIEDSYALSLRAFLFFFPYLFLFLTQDMFRDEIDSGALENVIFLQGGFRSYLLSKNSVLAALGIAVSLGGLLVYAASGLVSRQFTAVHLVRFLVGLEAGLYYLAAGGCLSLLLRGGSNVLAIVLGQVFLAIGLFLSMTGRHGWVATLFAGAFPDALSRLRFLALSLIVPNVVISRPRPVFVLGVAGAGLGLLLFERRRIRRLELFRK